MATTKKETAPEAAPQAPVAAAPAPQKKNHTVLIVVLVLVFVFVIVPGLIIGGLGIWGAKKIKEAANDGNINITVPTEDGNVSVNTSGQEWPDSIPSTIPKFEKGTILGTSKASDTWTLTYEKIEKAEIDAYLASLKAAGWIAASESNYSGSTYWNVSKGGYSINAIYDGGSKGLVLGITKDAE